MFSKIACINTGLFNGLPYAMVAGIGAVMHVYLLQWMGGVQKALTDHDTQFKASFDIIKDNLIEYDTRCPDKFVQLQKYVVDTMLQLVGPDTMGGGGKEFFLTFNKDEETNYFGVGGSIDE
ncbi:hypothetical protein DACRYDRAFT_104516 [Dacryopinax primogenitus]|uniref:Uncharacterized protein n=1 Tax=Dacryopinax primogenitus (strain DJM 731) TaxID=1858805 RepID=M5G7C5_DACPD|nr:uncharacterized protein DACRYDRAFT_104516 [Dacryopinax primogenitus]EJU04634.1 hypothetical protein DACRYDRAFT_104516 [Dacryopinax primogenitus]